MAAAAACQVFFNIRNLTLSVIVNLALLATATATQGARPPAAPSAHSRVRIPALCPHLVALVAQCQVANAATLELGQR